MHMLTIRRGVTEWEESAAIDSGESGLQGTRRVAESKERFAGGASLVRAKFQPPIVPEGVRPRVRIDALFEGHPRCRITLVSAPPGFGKTTAMVQAFTKLPGDIRRAWLTLDTDDGDPKSLIAYLIAALAEGGLPLDDFLAAAYAKLIGSSEQSLFDGLMAQIADLSAPIVLFLDDIHTIRDTKAVRFLELLLQRQPSNLRVVMSGRYRIGLSTSGLKLSGQLREIGAAELAFQPDEYGSHFGFDAETAAAIDDRCAGWPVAVKMAQLWFQNQGQRLKGLPPLSGRDGDFADYLTEQVLGALPDHLVKVLLRLSVVERFDGDLLNVLCECENGWALIEEIKARELFVTAANDETPSFAFHALFRSFLHERLSRREQHHIPALHVAAAQWFSKNGRVREAIAHACLSGDESCLATLLDEAGGWCLALSAGVHALSPLRDWSVARVEQSPTEIGLVATYLLLQRGEFERAHTVARHILSRMNDQVPPETRLSVAVLQSVLRLYNDEILDVDDVAAMRRDCNAFAATKPMLRACIEALNCYAAFHAADYRRAIAVGLAMVETCDRHGAYYAAVYVQLYVAMSQLALARFEDAEATLQEARRLTLERYGRQSDQAAMTDILLAEVLYERGRLVEAEALLDRSFERVRAGGIWIDLLMSGHSTLARIALATGKTRQALDILEISQLTAAERGRSLLDNQLKALRIYTLVRTGDIAAAAQLAETPEFQQFVRLDPASTPTSWRISEPARLAYAFVKIGAGEPEVALSILAVSARQAEVTGARRRLLDILLLLVAAYRANTMTEQSREALQRALSIGKECGFFQSFRDFASVILPVLSELTPDMLERDVCQYAGNLAAALGSKGVSQKSPLLSTRENEILLLLQAGMSSKDMARALSLTEGTVKVHRKRLYRKLDAHGRYAALKRAREHGLLSAPG